MDAPVLTVQSGSSSTPPRPKAIRTPTLADTARIPSRTTCASVSEGHYLQCRQHRRQRDARGLGQRRILPLHISYVGRERIVDVVERAQEPGARPSRQDSSAYLPEALHRLGKIGAMRGGGYKAPASAVC